MATRTRDELKSYFQSGKRPTQENFTDLIDSVLNKQDDGIDIDENDNVGIGISTPNAMLHIFNTESEGLLIENDNWPELDMIAASNTNDYRSKITLDPVSGALQFRLGQGAAGMNGQGSIKFMVSQSGNTGIGTISPNAILDVRNQGEEINIYRATDLSGQYRWRIDQDFDMFLTDNTGNDIIKVGQNESWFNSGNVGVGVVDPSAVFEVKDRGEEINIYRATDLSGQYRWRIDQDFDMFLTDNTGNDSIKIGQNESWFNSGNVGIGTTSPAEKLHIDNGKVLISSNSPTSLTLIGDSTNYINAGIVLQANHSTNYRGLGMFLHDINGGNEWFVGRPYAGSDQFVIYRNSGLVEHTDASAGLQHGDGTPTGVQAMFVLKSNNNVGIGATSPSATLSVNGSANKPGGGDWGVFSDRRLKKQVKSFRDGLELLTKVQPVRYRYNGKTGINDDNENVGIIAQEIRELFPYMVSTYTARLNASDAYDTELLSFDGSALKFVMVNAIKELDKRIKKRDQTIETLNKTVKGLNKTIQKQDTLIKKLDTRLTKIEAAPKQQTTASHNE